MTPDMTALSDYQQIHGHPVHKSPPGVGDESQDGVVRGGQPQFPCRLAGTELPIQRRTDPQGWLMSDEK